MYVIPNIDDQNKLPSYKVLRNTNHEDEEYEWS